MMGIRSTELQRRRPSRRKRNETHISQRGVRNTAGNAHCEHTVPNYELLTGQVTWASAPDGIIPTGAISGGQEAPPGAEVLHVCRANYQNGFHLGKLKPAFKGCHVSWGGKEINVAQYEAPITK